MSRNGDKQGGLKPFAPAFLRKGIVIAMVNSSGDNGGFEQTARTGSTPAASQGTGNIPAHCTSPCEVFTIANALAALFASNMTQDQLQTLINMLTLLVAGLATIVTQQQICEGIIVQPPEEI